MMMVIKILTKTWKGDDDKAWSALSWQAAGPAGSCTSHTHASLYNCNFFNSFLVSSNSILFSYYFRENKIPVALSHPQSLLYGAYVDGSHDGGDDICWYFWNVPSWRNLKNKTQYQLCKRLTWQIVPLSL